MASTCTVNKGSRQIGTGTVAAAGTTITGFSLTDSVLNTAAMTNFGRHVTVCITQAGARLGYTYNTKIVSDNGAGTLTMLDACPFVGA